MIFFSKSKKYLLFTLATLLLYSSSVFGQTPTNNKPKTQYERFQEQRLQEMQKYSDQREHDLDSLRTLYLRYEAERESLIERFLNNEKNDDLVRQSEEAEKNNPLVEIPTDQAPPKSVVPKPKKMPAETTQDDLLRREIEANRPVFYPVSHRYPITSPFDLNRFHPVLKTNKPHKGIDFGAPQGTPVYATANGLVEISRFSKSAGNWVMINHHNGYKTVYMHLSTLAQKENARVKRGDIIGYVGSTGYSTGPHLHYEVRLNNDPLNPKRFLLYKETN